MKAKYIQNTWSANMHKYLNLEKLSHFETGTEPLISNLRTQFERQKCNNSFELFWTFSFFFRKRKKFTLSSENYCQSNLKHFFIWWIFHNIFGFLLKKLSFYIIWRSTGKTFNVSNATTFSDLIMRTFVF